MRAGRHSVIEADVPRSRAERLQSFNHYTGDPGYAETYLKRLRAVTPEKVKATVADLLGKPRAEILTKPAAPAAGPSAAPSAAAKVKG